jgi:hypothetical protein
MVSKRRFKIVSSDQGKDGQEGTERGDDLGNKKFKNGPKKCRSLQAGPYYEVVIASGRCLAGRGLLGDGIDVVTGAGQDGN